MYVGMYVGNKGQNGEISEQVFRVEKQGGGRT